MRNRGSLTPSPRWIAATSFPGRKFETISPRSSRAGEHFPIPSGSPGSRRGSELPRLPELRGSEAACIPHRRASPCARRAPLRGTVRHAQERSHSSELASSAVSNLLRAPRDETLRATDLSLGSPPTDEVGGTRLASPEDGCAG